MGPAGDQDRQNYRSLRSLEEEDTGIFVEAMETLRGLRENIPAFADDYWSFRFRKNLFMRQVYRLGWTAMIAVCFVADCLPPRWRDFRQKWASCKSCSRPKVHQNSNSLAVKSAKKGNGELIRELIIELPLKN